MHRFLIEKINPGEKFIILKDSAQVHHLRDVLRIKPGEEVSIFDTREEYAAVVIEIAAQGIKLELKGRKEPNRMEFDITVACAIPKNVKMDDIVDKLTQLGVSRIIPLESERVVVKLDKLKKSQRLERWKKIALSAVKQSQRTSLVEVEAVADFKTVIGASRNYDLKLIPTLEGQRRTLKDILGREGKFKNILILIGPEGDFSPQETALAVENGFLPVDLGKQVLRVDTAAVAAVSFIKLNAEN